MKSALAIVAVLVATPLLAGCPDPIHDRQVAALGSETSIPKGEFHRAGQPCGACHQSTGPADTTFVVAGTIFASPSSLTGVYNADVELTDSVGTQFIAHTNCVGNFFVQQSDWTPRFPILVRVHKGEVALEMMSEIGREPSCGNCHKEVLGYDQARMLKPHIALFGGDEPNPDAPDAGCPVSNVVPEGTP